ncbi:MAG: hypothetical protein AAF597_03900, partial [Bacteroidota bacterium]
KRFWGMVGRFGRAGLESKPLFEVLVVGIPEKLYGVRILMVDNSSLNYREAPVRIFYFLVLGGLLNTYDKAVLRLIHPQLYGISWSYS